MSSANPLLQTSGLTAFDRIEPAHIEPAVKEILAKAEELLKKAESAPIGDWDALMDPQDAIALLFEYGWGPVGHFQGVNNSDDLRKAHEACLPGIVTFSLRMRQSRPLYERYVALRDSEGWSQMDAAQRRIVTQAIQSAEQSGIALEGQAQERFNEISQELSQISSDFSNHVLDATKAWSLDITAKDDVKGMPLSLRKQTAAAWAAAEENEGERRSGKRPLADPTGRPHLHPVPQALPKVLSCAKKS